MRRRGVAALALVVIFAVLGAPTSSAQQKVTVIAQPLSISVAVAPERIATTLGGKFSFTSTITNGGSTNAEGLIAHLNVLSLKDGTYVDPEDWSSNRTRYLEPIAAGESRTLTWGMQAVNDGDFGIYVAVLPEDGAPVMPVTGPTIRLDVAERKTLNAGGILPLVLGIPAAIGALALGVRLRRRG